MRPEDAEEYTQAVAQVVAGGYRQIALANRLGVPKALNLSIEQWVKTRLGGYVRYSLEERRDAVKTLKSEGHSERTIEGVLGIDRETVRKDLGKLRGRKPTTETQKNGRKPTTDPLDTITGIAATNEIRKQIELEERREQTRADRQAQRVAAAQAAQQVTADTDATVRHESIEVVAASLDEGSVDLVFTDPPYHDKTLYLYRTLGTAATRVLKDGGSLITYTSHHRIPEVIGMLQAAGLTFFWPLAMVYTSGQLARMTEYGIVVHFKPLLWFVKGTFRSRADMRFVDDVVTSTHAEKGSHPWQQHTAEARYYIEALTQPGDLVFDPFCGGGTTAVAAQQAGRRWLTCDVDEEAVWIARQRLRDTAEAMV